MTCWLVWIQLYQNNARRVLAITLFLALTLALSACSIEISQDGALAQEDNSGSSSTSISRIPVTWADLNLTGKLIYLSGDQKAGGFATTVQVLELKTGEISSVFQAPDRAYIYSAAVSPDGKQLVMSYSTPSLDQSFGTPALYTIPVDGSAAPQLLFTPPTVDDKYFQPVWSPDGKHIYCSRVGHYGPLNGQQIQGTEIYRIAYPGGTVEKIADQAFWLNTSPDSSRIVYVSIDPIDGANKLILADADGTNPQQVVMSGKWIPNVIDSPVFLPGGESILFSAVSQSPISSQTWFEKLLGVTVASAHTVPSDWWSVPVGGGPATQVTYLQAINLFASISPDKKYIASSSNYGLFVMNLDGSGAKMLIKDLGGIPTTVNWIP